MSDPDQQSPEAGFSLIELLVTVLLLGVVMSLVGTLLVTTLRAGQSVQAATGASRSAQVISDSLENGIRNSADFRTVPRSGGDELLVARVADRGGSTIVWSCSAWYYAAGTGTVRSTRLVSPFVLPEAEPTGWTLLGSDVAPLAAGAVFSVDGSRLDFSFLYEAAGAAPVAIDSSVVSRAAVPSAAIGSGAATC